MIGLNVFVNGARRLMSHRIELTFYEKRDGEVGIARPLTMDYRPAHEAQSEQTYPTVIIDIEAAQELMDQLWDCGLRPTEGSGSAGQLAATQKHLEDMRALVFQALHVEPKAK